MIPVEKKRGHYLGTEINEKWWRRYLRDGLFARGNGEYWFDNSALYFRRHLTKDPIIISLSHVLDIKVGKWHSGKWAGGAPVVKIIWKKSAHRLSSGFVFCRDAQENEMLVKEIKLLIRSDEHLQQS
jgi:hypothetical protein